MIFITIRFRCPGDVSVFKHDVDKCFYHSRFTKHVEHCNAKLSCLDKSDELQCDPCPHGRVKCAGNNSRCIHSRLLCDGSPQCPGKDDEDGCHIACPERQVLCRPGPPHCVDKTAVCNLSVVCSKTEITCENGCMPGFIKCQQTETCIANGFVCDGSMECNDYSDETSCLCEHYHLVPCPGTVCHHECIPEHWLCDGHPDCPDGSDELSCDICTGLQCNLCSDGTKLCTNHHHTIKQFQTGIFSAHNIIRQLNYNELI